LQLSLKLHQEVLKGKLKVHGNKSVMVGISYSNIGQVLKTLGRYEEAIENLEKALAIREKAKGEERDAAVTRDELGCCYQALGQVEKAREIRLKKGIDAVICSNEPCSCSAKQRKVPKLLACSQCKAIWYCSTNCQKADWKKIIRKFANLQS
jgi:tetratricopeptide (TPR) repeat protein